MRTNLQPALRVNMQPTPHHNLRVNPLRESETAEVYRFLSRNPLRTFGLLGMMSRNGLTGVNNRGKFYGCRDYAGNLRGVALIGHFTLFEARHPTALKAFAAATRQHTDIRLLLGEQSDIRRFWDCYGADRRAQPESAAYSLLTANSFPATQPPAALRPATLDDLEEVVAAHAQGTYEEKGFDPLQTEPEAFRRRCEQRIEQQATWLCRTPEQLVFKAEIICATSAIAYLEGVWVPPALRRSNFGQHCLAALGRQLLEQSSVVCLLADDDQPARRAFYEKAGFALAGQFIANCF